MVLCAFLFITVHKVRLQLILRCLLLELTRAFRWDIQLNCGIQDSSRTRVAERMWAGN